MQNRLLLVLLTSALAVGLLAPTVLAQSSKSSTTTLYRWVDDNGVIHFSDSPRPGAQDPSEDEFKVRAPNVSRSPRPSPSSVSSATSTDGDADASGITPAPLGYQSLSITSPANGDTLWNIGGTLNVSLQVSPGLQPGDGIVILMDGRVMNQRPATSTSVTLSNVYRGEHVLVASIRDANGVQQIASPPIRFVVQQSTVN